MKDINLESRTCVNKLRVMMNKVVSQSDEKCYYCQNYINSNCKDYVSIQSKNIPIRQGLIPFYISK